MKPTGWASPMRHVPSDRGWGACLDRLRARHACTVDGPYCDASGWHVVLTVFPDRSEPLEPQRFAAPTMKELTRDDRQRPGDRMSDIPNYPKIWHAGDPKVSGLIGSDVIVQEKVDGSQFSFALLDGRLSFKSKGQQILEWESGLFAKACQHIESVADRLVPGWIYRAETLAKPKHNVLAYQRVPLNHLVLFDVQYSEGWLSDAGIATEAASLAVEAAPVLASGLMESYDQFYPLLQLESFLGGPKIEGFVIKNREKPLFIGDYNCGPHIAKYVSEAFKEKHAEDWPAYKAGKDRVKAIGEGFRTEARFMKAVQRRRDAGELECSPRDIGPLMRDLSVDFEAEWTDWIKTKLYEEFRKDIMRSANSGFAEWFKRALAEGTIEGAEAS